ncbi:MAG: DUF1549 domain-containing protein, partial [Verrucomicrobium sp.]|nr:DUF1549 domain-containing protein [Verrucomicrobium sp.]
MKHLPALLLAGASTLTVASPVDFARDVAPILTTHCTECHGPNVQKDKVSLQSRKHTLGESGWQKVLTPGQPGSSRLIKAVSGPDPEMPKKGPKLTVQEIATLKQWIAEGAAWPEEITLQEKVHTAGQLWSLQPVQKVSLPAGSDYPVDAFLSVALQEKGLKFSPQADRRTLIRRLSFDLLGLPPSPEEVAAFASDAGPLAYEKLVDRYLASP